jgi:hypothetical protein
VRIWPALLVCLSFPSVTAEAEPGIARELARERFAPVSVTRQLPPPLWDGLALFVRRKPLVDAGVAPAGKVPESDVRPVTVERAFAFGGVGSKLDFVIYRHSPAWGGIGDHDHLLVFRHLPGGKRSLVFSCVGALPRKAAQVSAAVADGRCQQRTGSVETD